MNIYSYLSLFSCIIYIQLAFYSFIKGKKVQVNREFSLLCLIFAWWSFCYIFYFAASNEEEAFKWFKIGAIGWSCYPLFMIRFAWAISKKINKFKNTILFPILSVISLVFLIMIFDNGLIVDKIIKIDNQYYYHTNDYTWQYWLYYIFLNILIFTSVFHFYSWKMSTPSKREKLQAKIIILSLFLALALGYITDVTLPLFELRIVPSIAIILCLIWVVGIAYSILKFKLLDLSPQIAINEIIDHMKEILIFVNKNGDIIDINNFTEKLINYPSYDIIGKPIGVLFGNNNFTQKIRYQNFDETETIIETYLLPKKSSPIPVALNYSIIKDKSSDIIGVVIVGHDIRQTKQLQEEIRVRQLAEEALKISNKKLKELDEIKTNFLSNVSHELRTPLTSIMGFAKLIQSKLNDENFFKLLVTDEKASKALTQLQKNIQIITSESERLTRLINDILDLAKLESGKMHWENEITSFEEIVEKAWLSTSSLFEEKNLYFKKEFKDNVHLIYVDKDKFQQVLINLFSNAIKYTNQGGITCVIKKDNNNLRVEVIDTGVGIDTNHFYLIFDKFKQVNGVLENKTQGTGLGLTICKEIIEHYGGKIWVESELGKGSSFIFNLPFDNIIKTSNKEEL